MRIPKEASGVELSRLLSINERTLRKLVERGVLTKTARGSYDIVDSISSFIAYREAAVAAQSGKGEWGVQRAAVYRERALALRAAREEREGVLAPVFEFKVAEASLARLVRDKILATPTRIAPRLTTATTAAEAERLMRSALEEALEDLAAWDFDREDVDREYQMVIGFLHHLDDRKRAVIRTILRSKQGVTLEVQEEENVDDNEGVA
jgi:hypothetical protein